MSEQLVAVVVHYADPARTEACVRSLLQAGLEAIVVDNASTYDDSRPATEVIRPGTNLGYGGGANVGLRRAFERAELALLLNDDVTVEHPEGLAELDVMMRRDPSIGIAGPLVAAPDGGTQPTVERWPSLRRALLLAAGHGPVTPDEQLDVEAVNGVCLAIRREAFEAVEGFDEHYFLYAEELDLCRRVTLAGYRVVYAPIRSVIHHHEPGEVRGDGIRLIRVNYVRFCRDHRSYLSAVTVAILFLGAACARRREPMALARGLVQVLTERPGAVVDRVLVPAVIAVWVVLLALGSSYDPGLRQIGSSGKFVMLFVLIGIEAPRLLRRPRAYLADLRPGGLHAAAAALIGFGALSALWSTAPRHTLTYALGLGLLFTAILLGPWRMARSPTGARSLAQGVLLGSAAVVVINALAVLNFGDLAFYDVIDSPRRFRGILENPDEVGSYVIVAGLALWQPIERARSLRNAPGRRWLTVSLAVAVGLVFVIELALSGSRSGLLLLLCVGGIFLSGLLAGSRGLLAAAGIALACVAIAAAMISSAELRRSLPKVVRPASLSNFGGRTEAWSASLHLIGQRPLGGFGLGTESQASLLYRADGARLLASCGAMPQAWKDQLPSAGCVALVSPARRLMSFAGDNSHQSFLGLGVQLGAVALAATALALVLALGQIALKIRRGAAFEVALLAGLVAGVGWACVETYLFNPGNMITGVFWLLLVIALAAPARTGVRE